MDIGDFSSHLAQSLNCKQFVVEIGQDSETTAIRKMTFQHTLEFHESRDTFVF